jgi:hypothetical protein
MRFSHFIEREQNRAGFVWLSPPEEVDGLGSGSTQVERRCDTR